MPYFPCGLLDPKCDSVYSMWFQALVGGLVYGVREFGMKDALYSSFYVRTCRVDTTGLYIPV